MKVVDIADELYREIAEDSNYSIASISYWVRANIGRLNSHINTFLEIKSSTLEIVKSTDVKNDNVLVESEIVTIVQMSSGSSTCAKTVGKMARGEAALRKIHFIKCKLGFGRSYRFKHLDPV